ncbi:ABC transporter permease [Defluviimonas sp. D31]|uniref:ABC transporter permease n=1 Tax=Defluviimonas sp. D31 TaxID=3083253 RepID=UPI00296F1E1E|nr:ABC transporter permease [Defluviimonas sp. D31]MDW4550545.1 ABC transporter permease [Defluviimonas sp. D31]
MTEESVTARKGQGFETTLDQSDTRVASFEHRGAGPLDRVQRALHGNPTLVPVLVLVVSIAVFSLPMVTDGKFLTAFNLSLVMQQVSIIGILAAAQTLVILTAGIDLSVGALMVFAAVVMGMVGVDAGLPAPIAILAGFVLAIACGALNGLLVTRLKLPPFIVTLGTWSVYLSLLRLLTGSQSIRSQDIDAEAPLLKLFGLFINLGGARITFGVILMVLVFAALWYVLNKTAWGRHVYAVGDDKEAAELAGIRTDRTLMAVYMLAGFICAIAAWASIGRVGSISPNAFAEANLQSITAVVIGGISLFGGRGSILGPLFGALIVGVFESGLRLAGLDVQWQVFAIGWLIILAVAIDQWIRRVSA